MNVTEEQSCGCMKEGTVNMKGTQLVYYVEFILVVFVSYLATTDYPECNDLKQNKHYLTVLWVRLKKYGFR